MHLPALSPQMNLIAALVLNGYSTKVSHYEKENFPNYGGLLHLEIWFY